MSIGETMLSVKDIIKMKPELFIFRYFFLILKIWVEEWINFFRFKFHMLVNFFLIKNLSSLKIANGFLPLIPLIIFEKGNPIKSKKLLDIVKKLITGMHTHTNRENLNFSFLRV